MFGFGKPKEPQSPLLFSTDIICVGANYPCKKKPSVMRTTLLSKMTTGTAVSFTITTFQGKPMITVDNVHHLDTCSLSQQAADYLTMMIDNLELRGYAVDPSLPKFHIDVYGKYKKEFHPADIVEARHEYTYHLNNDDGELFMLPIDMELPCTLEEFEEGYLVKRGEALIGIISDKRKVNLKRMLSEHDCITTIKTVMETRGNFVEMILRF